MIKQILPMFCFPSRGECCSGYKLNTTTGQCDSTYKYSKYGHR